MGIVKGPRIGGSIHVQDPVVFEKHVTLVQSSPFGDTMYVDNRAGADTNDGKSPDQAKATIQNAIDACPSNSGSIVYVMGAGVTYEYNGTNVVNLSGSDLYGVYRENIHLDATDHGLQLIGINRPFITGNDGTSENTGETPTIQIGNYGVNSYGPKYCRISGFHIGGWGDDADDADNSNRHGCGIAIGEYADATYNDDCYSHLIDNCYFRATNCEGGSEYTNTEDVHTWIKVFGAEKIEIKDCYFFQGEHAIAFLGNQNNQCMATLVENCNFQYQTVYTLYSSATPLWNVVKDCTINPSASGEELNLTGGALGNSLINCIFPQCDEALDGDLGYIAAPNLGTHTGWLLMGCHGQKGMISENT